MARYEDLTGLQFGRLSVEKTYMKRCGSRTRKFCLCQCECGTTKEIPADHLTRGKIRSCGCLRKEVSTQRAQKHGQRNGRLYNSWRGMKDRCLNPNHKSYRNYGGKGVGICVQWLDFERFSEWAYSNGYTEGLTIDRIDPQGNYEPQNCRWIPASENISRANHSRKGGR